MSKNYVGYLVKDQHGRFDIVMHKDNKPDSQWLRGQSIKPTVEGQWYTAFPLTGGAVLINENDFSVVRKATVSDIAEAYQNANGFAKDEMDKSIGVIARD